MQCRSRIPLSFTLSLSLSLSFHYSLFLSCFRPRDVSFNHLVSSPFVSSFFYSGISSFTVQHGEVGSTKELFSLFSLCFSFSLFLSRDLSFTFSPTLSHSPALICRSKQCSLESTDRRTSDKWSEHDSKD